MARDDSHRQGRSRAKSSGAKAGRAGNVLGGLLSAKKKKQKKKAALTAEADAEPVEARRR